MAVSCGKDWADSTAVAKLKQWILDKLGCNVIAVELTDEQLEAAITDAQEYWMQWVENIKAVDLNITAEDREYADTDIGTDVDAVVDVIFDSIDNSLRDVYGWADVQINPYQWIYGGNGGYSAITQYLMYREDADRIMSADRDWEWDESRKVLIISPRYSETRTVKVIYVSRCFDFTKMRTFEWQQFRRYALAQAMKILSVIRTKYSELPSATGSFSMDGDSLWANAEALEMGVDEKMRSLRRSSMEIFTG